MTDTFMAPGATLLAGVRSDPGRVRTNNEDLPLVDPGRGLFGVIDGIGGQAAGEVAARIARDVIQQRLARPLGTPAERVREALAIANNEIYRRAQAAPDLKGMACVATLALVSDDTITIGHVGDTRLYKIRPGQLAKVTHDHSPVGEREDAQELSEAEAMRHPRRNEVFRDIGSAYRDKDEEEFVEVIVEPLERDCAILLCSDGLTDMIPSAAIEQVVQQLAGHPQAVADALVGAANDAGGRDNVTVVYAEAPDFAAAMRRARDPGSEVPTAPMWPVGLPDAAAEAPMPPIAAARPSGGAAASASAPAAARREHRPSTWFSAGALAGVALTLGLAWQLGEAGVAPRRTHVVDPTGAGTFRRISDAMAVARPGDVVRLEPGVYQERVAVSDGVDLAARLPGTATVTRPANATGEAVGISLFGTTGSNVSGIRVQSTPELPLEVGVRVAGQGGTLDQLDVAGPMRAGVEVLPASSVTVQGSWFAVDGSALSFTADAHGALTSNVVLRASRGADVPLAVAPSSRLSFRRNIFVGFGPNVGKGLSVALQQQLLERNVVIASEPSLLR